MAFCRKLEEESGGNGLRVGILPISFRIKVSLMFKYLAVEVVVLPVSGNNVEACSQLHESNVELEGTLPSLA